MVSREADHFLYMEYLIFQMPDLEKYEEMEKELDFIINFQIKLQ